MGKQMNNEYFETFRHPFFSIHRKSALLPTLNGNQVTPQIKQMKQLHHLLGSPQLHGNLPQVTGSGQLGGFIAAFEDL
jgi:hypothetical protein